MPPRLDGWLPQIIVVITDGLLISFNISFSFCVGTISTRLHRRTGRTLFKQSYYSKHKILKCVGRQTMSHVPLWHSLWSLLRILLDRNPCAQNLRFQV